MTTHELADLLGHLRSGLGGHLKSDAGKAFDEAMAAFRELPNQPLKKVADQLRALNRPSPAKQSGPSVPDVVERIRAIRSGTAAPDSLGDLSGFKNTQLKEVLKAFDQSGTSTIAGNLERVMRLLAPVPNSSHPPEREPVSPPIDPRAIEEGVQLFLRLRDTRTLSIPEVRAGFAPFRDYPRPVLEEVSRRVGYTPHGSQQEILSRLQENLEAIKMNQLRTELIGAGA